MENRHLIDYQFKVPGPPIPKQRPYFVHKDKNGKALPYVKVINRQEDAEVAFKWAAMKYMTERGGVASVIEDGPIALGFTFIMPIPRSSWPQYKIRDLRRGMTFYHYGTPDADNLIKFCKDCLQGLCYKNDSQVAVYDPYPVKIYGFNPMTIIRVRSLPECEILEGDRFEINKLPGDNFFHGLT